MGHLPVKEILEYKGFLWIVLRKIKDEHDVNITEWKTITNADMCLRKQGWLYFVDIIEEPEIIEETRNEQKN